MSMSDIADIKIDVETVNTEYNKFLKDILDVCTLLSTSSVWVWGR
jgi:hypothetical protein